MNKQPFPLKSKIKASSIHLIISLLIFVLIALWVYFSLYPSFYFNMSGGWQGLGLMFGVDVVLGPLLTFLVFNPYKKLREIISDLVIVGLVQLAALSYGLYTVYQEHPSIVVIYDQGIATALPYREMNENNQLQKLEYNALKSLAGVPVVIYRAVEGQAKWETVNDVADDLAHTDKLTRNSMQHNAEDMTQLTQLEQQHGKVWVLAAMGKYTGAYIAVDKDLNYLAKIGEKPL